MLVNLAGQAASAVADKEGRWLAKLPPFKQPGGPFELAVGGRATHVFKDVYVGDVWLCGGQSNMEMQVNGCNAAEDIQNAKTPLIRCIRVQKKQSSTPEKDITGSWQVCSPQTVGGFTAVGYFFARTVHEETKVPIGLIDSNWGGTAIEPWIPAEALKAVPEAGSRDDAEKQLAAWDGKSFPWSILYNGMIAPVVPYALKGALWYQGESNGGEGDSYYHKMRALIGGWRTAFGVGDFPFYFVQLANWQAANDNPAGGDGWAKIREAQRRALEIPSTGMAVIIDTVPLAARGNIHPRNKLDVGTRLARWALACDYGKADVVPSGPLFKALAVEGAKARVTFDHVGGGLMVARKEGKAPALEDAGAPLKQFAIAGEDRKWHWADAVIDGDAIVVSSPAVAQPVAVRYAFSMNPHGANLYNRAGLPAAPFRTDDW